MRIFFDFGALARDLRLVHLALRLRGEVRAGTHRQRAGERAGETGRQHHRAAAGVSGHARDDAEHGAETVVDAVDRIANPAGAADMPALAPQNRFQRRARRRQRSTGERPQHHRVIAFVQHRLFGDAAVGGVAEPRQQLVVLGLRRVLFLLEPVQDHIGIGDPLEPRQLALDVVGIGRAPGRRRDALRPAGGVPIGQAHQNRLAPVILFPVGEMAIDGGRLDFAAPHLLHGRQVDLVDRHQKPISRSKTTIVPMPAAMSSTCRAALASMSPRCRSGIRSAMAM